MKPAFFGLAVGIVTPSTGEVEDRGCRQVPNRPNINEVESQRENRLVGRRQWDGIRQVMLLQVTRPVLQTSATPKVNGSSESRSQRRNRRSESIRTTACENCLQFLWGYIREAKYGAGSFAGGIVVNSRWESRLWIIGDSRAGERR